MTAQTASPASHPTTDNSKVWPAMVTGLVVLSGLQGNSKLSVVSGIWTFRQFKLGWHALSPRTEKKTAAAYFKKFLRML
jgi:hypothetical protein